MAQFIATKLGVKAELLPAARGDRISYLQTKKADVVISTLGKNPGAREGVDLTVARKQIGPSWLIQGAARAVRP